MRQEIPRIAIVGRQNVGKSTLVNRLFGGRQAIAHDAPGVTRDRLELEASWRGRRFGLVDTAGYLHRPRGVEAAAATQTDRATGAADLILLVVDAKTGPLEEDAQLARQLRRATAPILVVVNKADAAGDELESVAFLSLGLGEPVPVSSLHGRGIGDLLDRIGELLPEAPADPGAEIDEPRFAIIGRPNVGKSSLFNRLLGDERSVVSEQSGTTRDAVDSVVDWPDLGPARFVDTAGIRRGGKVRGVEYFSFVRATQAVEASDVVLLVIDARDGFTADDKRIAAKAMDAGRALLVVANKWDLVEERDASFKHLGDQLTPFAHAPLIRTSALRGSGVHRIPHVLIELHARWSSRVPTHEVNAVLRRALQERPTPRSSGTLHYATQVGVRPPTFVVFGGAREPGPGYRRYLSNRLRSEFGLAGVPIRLRFRARRSR